MVRILIPLTGFLFALSSPFLVSAQTDLPAGFAPGQVWFSPATPLTGDTVELFTVIYDASGTPLEGSVSFSINEEVVGSVPFSLRAGEAEIRSVRWTATPGEHTLSATFDTAIHQETKQSATLQNAATASTTIRVNEPEPAPKSERTSTSTSTIAGVDTSALLASVLQSPLVGSVLGSALSASESVRTAGETFLVSQTRPENEDPEIAFVPSSEGSVLGTSTEKRDDPSSQTLTQKAAAAALPLFSYPAIFYPFLLIVFGIAFWFLTKGLRNPQRRRRR